MDGEDQFSPRLDMIETEWTMLRQAHGASIGTGGAARNSLVLRYSSAIHAYVKAITKDDADADELSQDVVLRLLKGDFAGADPNRGRFRDLLKVAVKNMVRNYWAKQKKRKTVDYDFSDTVGEDATDAQGEWETSWRNNVLELGWSRLSSFQSENPSSALYPAMRVRAENPDLDSTALAKLLSEEVGREMSPANFRQQLRRGRVKFAEFIVEEVANGLDSTDSRRIEDELIAVGLFEHVKDVLPENWSQA